MFQEIQVKASTWLLTFHSSEFIDDFKFFKTWYLQKFNQEPNSFSSHQPLSSFTYILLNITLKTRLVSSNSNFTVKLNSLNEKSTCNKEGCRVQQMEHTKQTCELMSCISEHSYSSQMLTKLHNNISQHNSISQTVPHYCIRILACLN